MDSCTTGTRASVLPEVLVIFKNNKNIFWVNTRLNHKLFNGIYILIVVTEKIIYYIFKNYSIYVVLNIKLHQELYIHFLSKISSMISCQFFNLSWCDCH